MGFWVCEGNVGVLGGENGTEALGPHTGTSRLGVRWVSRGLRGARSEPWGFGGRHPSGRARIAPRRGGEGASHEEGEGASCGVSQAHLPSREGG